MEQDPAPGKILHPEVDAPLWSFHNARSGLCFPSYESIAETPAFSPGSNRIVRVRDCERDPFGHIIARWRVLRTSTPTIANRPREPPLKRAHPGFVASARNRGIHLDLERVRGRRYRIPQTALNRGRNALGRSGVLHPRTPAGYLTKVISVVGFAHGTGGDADDRQGDGAAWSWGPAAFCVRDRSPKGGDGY